jgi:hypothetical protein
MNIRYLKIGILHSLIGKSDGVSIVIDQTVNAMIENMHVRLGNIYFLASHSSPRFNVETNEIFWHKSDILKTILRYYDQEPPSNLEDIIIENAQYAKKVLAEFIKKHDIDLLIAHNISHPYNFITAIAIGMYLEELREKGIIWPKVVAWWHDSHYERDRFRNPNAVIKKFLKYLPGRHINGIVYINTRQKDYIQQNLTENFSDSKFIERYLKHNTVMIPNSSDIFWDWRKCDWGEGKVVAPTWDSYNNDFFEDVGLASSVRKSGYSMKDTFILLQHTRIVPRKRIERTIDLAFKMDKLIREEGKEKCIGILISGYSGDEQTEYKKHLQDYFEQNEKKYPEHHVVMVFGEHVILSHRDIIVDRKYYKFEEIPAIVAGHGGIGTYFSELEGYGNNLLEMISYGLPVVINKYEIYKKDIEKLGFHLPATENGEITDDLVKQAYRLFYDIHHRNQIVKHNLEVLDRNLSHKIISDKLVPFIRKVFTRELCNPVTNR